ncbi:hypothetical protein [Streptomyces sp. TP-A0356]|uniref:hypothetical protein n=1 Tax=Streptomyces sp. TP-A0356 TaxID=1359208 RepID=UPI001F2D7B94|nr:hypothetical protein [Streptomyces sp. TP-A0356]
MPAPGVPDAPPRPSGPPRRTQAPQEGLAARPVARRPERPPTNGKNASPSTPADGSPERTDTNGSAERSGVLDAPGSRSAAAGSSTSVNTTSQRPDTGASSVRSGAVGSSARSAVDGSSGASGPARASGRSGVAGPVGRSRAVVRPFRIEAPDSLGSAGVAGDTAPPASGGGPDTRARHTSAPGRFPSLRPDRDAEPVDPPPPAASARFPDAPPTAGVPPRGAEADVVPSPRTPLPAEGIVETTARLGHQHDDESRHDISSRPFVTLARPDTRGVGAVRPWPFGGRPRPRAAAAAACLVLGLGLIGGAVTGSWLTGDGPADGARGAFTVAASLWHSVPVDQLFPPSVQGPGAGPGGSDRSWTRIAVAPDSGCKDAFDSLLGKALAPVGCLRLLRATYTDATRSHVTTVGLLFTRADAAAMAAVNSRFKKEGLDRRTDLMPRPYAAKGTVAEGFGDAQRASWTISVRTDVPVVVYAVSGFADGRTVTEPQPAADAMATGATTAPAQAGLGNEAVGLADRIEGALRETVTSASEKPS